MALTVIAENRVDNQLSKTLLNQGFSEHHGLPTTLKQVRTDSLGATKHRLGQFPRGNFHALQAISVGPQVSALPVRQ